MNLLPRSLPVSSPPLRNLRASRSCPAYAKRKRPPRLRFSRQRPSVTAGELGYAIELGGARSFGELSKRFAAIAEANQEIAFDRMEPRVTLADTAAGVEARLLVGPFDSLVDAEETCAQIALPAGIGCRPTGFAGEVIARQ